MNLSEYMFTPELTIILALAAVVSCGYGIVKANPQKLSHVLMVPLPMGAFGLYVGLLSLPPTNGETILNSVASEEKVEHLIPESLIASQDLERFDSLTSR